MMAWGGRSEFWLRKEQLPPRVVAGKSEINWLVRQWNRQPRRQEGTAARRFRHFREDKLADRAPGLRRTEAHRIVVRDFPGCGPGHLGPDVDSPGKARRPNLFR